MKSLHPIRSHEPLPVVLAGARGHGRSHLLNVHRLEGLGLVRLAGVCELRPLDAAELDGIGSPVQSEDFDALLARLRTQVSDAYAARSPELRALDERRLVTPDWFQRTDVLGYVCYTDRFAGRLTDLPPRIDYLRELGVSFLHLMPLLQPRPGPNDGGYAVMDYRAVDPRLGTLDELRSVAAALRAAGISLVLDLVCNHTAREHAKLAAGGG